MVVVRISRILFTRKINRKIQNDIKKLPQEMYIKIMSFLRQKSIPPPSFWRWILQKQVDF